MLPDESSFQGVSSLREGSGRTFRIGLRQQTAYIFEKFEQLVEC